jgi:hypothetical protein
MADTDEQVLTDEEIVEEDPTTDAPTLADAQEEWDAAQETEDPNDNLEAARTDVGREINVPPTHVGAEAPEPEKVSVSLNPEFTEPTYEEYVDDKGVTHGKVGEAVAPEGDVKVYSATAEALGLGEDGYITLPAEVPPSVAADLEGSPAVVIE